MIRKNINNHRHADDAILKAESEEELKNLLMRVKEESEKAGLKLSIQKRSWYPAPSLYGNRRGKSGKSDRFLFSWAPKSLRTVTTAMKLKDMCSLEEKL